MTASSLLKPIAALLILGIAVPLVAIAINHPPLTSSPGLLIRLQTYLTENVVETLPYSAYPERRITTYRRPPEAVLDAALAVVQARGWELVTVDRERHYLHAVAQTPVWGFRDDVEVRVERTENGASELHLRSASRIGLGDLGKNTRRIIELRLEIERRL